YHVISSVQLQLIALTSFLRGDIYTDHLSTDNQCSAISATCQCSSIPHTSAHQCTGAHQCHISVPIRAAFQCHQSVPPISASQCRLSMPL
ncbi:unnamed protein product, partial [Staurois parvus]